jgi:hypothetical protein
LAKVTLILTPSAAKARRRYFTPADEADSVEKRGPNV